MSGYVEPTSLARLKRSQRPGLTGQQADEKLTALLQEQQLAQAEASAGGPGNNKKHHHSSSEVSNYPADPETEEMMKGKMKKNETWQILKPGQTEIFLCTQLDINLLNPVATAADLLDSHAGSVASPLKVELTLGLKALWKPLEDNCKAVGLEALLAFQFGLDFLGLSLKLMINFEGSLEMEDVPLKRAHGLAEHAQHTRAKCHRGVAEPDKCVSASPWMIFRQAWKHSIWARFKNIAKRNVRQRESPVMKALLQHRHFLDRVKTEFARYGRMLQDPIREGQLSNAKRGTFWIIVRKGSCLICKQRNFRFALRVRLNVRGGMLADTGDMATEGVRVTEAFKADDGEVVIQEKLGFAVEFTGSEWEGDVILELVGHKDHRKVIATKDVKVAFGLKKANIEESAGDENNFVNLVMAWEPPTLARAGRVVSGGMEQPLGALFAAFELFADKLPGYAEQVGERLVDNKRDRVSGRKGGENMDCAGYHRIGHLKGHVKKDRKGRCLCPLACTDGSGLQRYMRFGGEDQDEGVVEDQRALNFAKAQRVAKKMHNATSRFQRNFAVSAANLFVRTVSDIVALWSIYHADDAHWEGQCSALKPKFRLPFELWTSHEFNPEAKNHKRHRMIYRAGRYLAVPGTKMSRVEDASEKDNDEFHILKAEEYNPFDHWPWIFQWGYKRRNTEKTNDARQAFLGRLRPLHYGLGPTTPISNRSAEVLPHLSCEAATLVAGEVLGVEPDGAGTITARHTRSRGTKVPGSAPLEREDVKAAARRLDQLSSTLEGWAYQDSKLTLGFNNLCEKSEEACAEFQSCEVARIPTAFAVSLPSVMRLIVKTKSDLNYAGVEADKITDQVAQGRLDEKDGAKQAKKHALKAMKHVRSFLKKLGSESLKRKMAADMWHGFAYSALPSIPRDACGYSASQQPPLTEVKFVNSPRSCGYGYVLASENLLESQYHAHWKMGAREQRYEKADFSGIFMCVSTLPGKAPITDVLLTAHECGDGYEEVTTRAHNWDEIAGVHCLDGEGAVMADPEDDHENGKIMSVEQAQQHAEEHDLKGFAYDHKDGQAWFIKEVLDTADCRESHAEYATTFIRDGAYQGTHKSDLLARPGGGLNTVHKDARLCFKRCSGAKGERPLDSLFITSHECVATVHGRFENAYDISHDKELNGRIAVRPRRNHPLPHELWGAASLHICQRHAELIRGPVKLHGRFWDHYDEVAAKLERLATNQDVQFRELAREVVEERLDRLLSAENHHDEYRVEFPLVETLWQFAVAFSIGHHITFCRENVEPFYIMMMKKSIAPSWIPGEVEDSQICLRIKVHPPNLELRWDRCWKRGYDDNGKKIYKLFSDAFYGKQMLFEITSQNLLPLENWAANLDSNAAEIAGDALHGDASAFSAVEALESTMHLGEVGAQGLLALPGLAVLVARCAVVVAISRAILQDQIPINHRHDKFKHAASDVTKAMRNAINRVGLAEWEDRFGPEIQKLVFAENDCPNGYWNVQGYFTKDGVPLPVAQDELVESGSSDIALPKVKGDLRQKHGWQANRWFMCAKSMECGELGVIIRGKPFLTWSVQHRCECEAQCAGAQKCHTWSFDRESKECKLFDDPEELVRQTTVNNKRAEWVHASGTKERQSYYADQWVPVDGCATRCGSPHFESGKHRGKLHVEAQLGNQCAEDHCVPRKNRTSTCMDGWEAAFIHRRSKVEDKYFCCRMKKCVMHVRPITGLSVVNKPNECKSDERVRREIVTGRANSKKQHKGAIRFGGLTQPKTYICAHRDARKKPFLGLALMKQHCKGKEICQQVVDGCARHSEGNNGTWEPLDLPLGKGLWMCAMTEGAEEPPAPALLQLTADAAADQQWHVPIGTEHHAIWKFNFALEMQGACNVKTTYYHAKKTIDFDNGTTIVEDFMHTKKTAYMLLTVSFFMDIGPFYFGAGIGFDFTDVLVKPVNTKSTKYNEARVRFCKHTVRLCGAFCNLDGALQGFTPAKHDQCPGEGHAPATRQQCEGHHGINAEGTVRWAIWIDNEAMCDTDIRPILYTPQGSEEGGYFVDESETEHQSKHQHHMSQTGLDDLW